MGRLVRDRLITSALTAAPPWRALLPTQTLQSASALITRFPVLTVPNVNAPTVRDWLMAQMTALTATPPWRALLPTQTLESASALQTRFPMRTVQNAKRNRTAHRMEIIGVPFPVGTVWTIFLMIGAMETMEKGQIVVTLVTLITINVLRMGSSPLSTDVKSARPSNSPLP